MSEIENLTQESKRWLLIKREDWRVVRECVITSLKEFGEDIQKKLKKILEVYQ